MRFAHHEPEETEPGHEAWTPTMGRAGKAFAWAILAMIGLGTAAMVWMIVAG